jgi:crossover junction endodeoxyribonuclease RuvC
MKENNRIIAIDPGFERLGIAIIDVLPKETLVHSECFHTSTKETFAERLHILGTHVREIIKKYEPRELAIETLFISNNQKTAMHVAEARGVVIYECARAGLSVHEYNPLQIKVAVTGYGKASKDDVMKMVPKLIRMETASTSDDELDAIACGLTHTAHAGSRYANMK